MKLKFNVTGMTCAACSARVEKVTRNVNGVEKADVNLLAGTMQVEAESEAVTAELFPPFRTQAIMPMFPERRRKRRKRKPRQRMR